MIRIASLLLSLSIAFAAMAKEVTTIILVRHAEKSADAAVAADPPLTEAGQARAKSLARMLAGANVSAIYTTPYARTRGTAAPLAEALKLTPIEVTPGQNFPSQMASKLIAEHAEKTVLVVGHSNTTQQVMKALGIADAPKIEESEYDNLFIVTIADGAAPRMLRLKY